tara:strand:- start:3526 stop:5919 length:2394 start_codon:yes stop_codon:yes gene_type:complete
MKNRLLIKIVFIYFFVICKVFASTIFLESDNIKIFENGNLIHAFYGKAFDKEEQIEIEGDKSIYNKNLSQLTIINNVKFFDIKKNIYIESEKAHYNKKLNIVETIGKTFVKIEDKYQIYSKNLIYNRKIMEITSEDDTIINDDIDNVYNFEDGFKFEINKEIITSKKTNVIDSFNNNYNFENAKINLVKNEIIGKEITINFVDDLFGQEDNDPKLRGKSTISNENFTKIYKSVFSTCNTENKKCRDWELQSEEFNHDKKEKIFEYKKSWLKMFDKRVMYFPYFNHPDPTVDRKSGFLTPSWTNSENLGRWIHIPYFKVISEDKDLTYNPRIYLEDKLILQTEYRRAMKNETMLVSDFSVNHDGNNRSSHFFANLDGKLNETTDFEVQFQDVTNDNYLKLYELGLTSPIIKNESLLTSHLKLNKIVEDDYSINLSTIVYEDLAKKDSDKFQYVFPSFNFVNYIPIDERYNGSFTFYSSGFQNVYDTNSYQMVVNNDFLFGSDSIISKKGFSNSYELLLKNTNSYSENSSNYPENNDHNIFGISMFKMQLPMKKELKNSTNFLKPIASFKYSPNNTKDISDKDVRLDYTSVFSLNRIAQSDMVEGGKSLSLGLEFENQNLNNEKNFGFNLANVLRNRENVNLPNKSKIGQTRSDIVGEMEYNLNETIDLNYKFSYDRDLDHSNYDSIGSTFTVNNFVTSFDYLTEHNDLPDSEVLKIISSYDVNDRSNLRFETRKDLDKDFTEYYNLIYTYKTDCLEALFEYNKKYYRDGKIIPDESLFFTLKFIPFAEVKAKDTKFNR